MPSVEPITRIIIRQGFENERAQANFLNGEPAYAIDSKRMYIGDGVTTGGNPVGMRNCMFATFTGNNTNINSSYAPAIGDIVYDYTSKLLYTLVDASYGLITSWVPIGTALVGDNVTISTAGDVISLIASSLDFSYIASSSVGRGLELINGGTTIRVADPSAELNFTGNQLSITPASVTNSMLSNMASNTVKGRTVSTGSPQDIPFDQLAALLAPLILQYAPAISVVVTGTMFDFGGTTAPAGYLACDGSAVSRTTYADLFAAIGVRWGAGNGSTTFNVPDLSRRATVGSGGTGTSTLGNQVGNTGGAESVLLTANQSGLRSHAHTGGAFWPNNTSPRAEQNQRDGPEDYTHFTTTGAVAAAPAIDAHNNVQPSAVVLKIIKT